MTLSLTDPKPVRIFLLMTSVLLPTLAVTAFADPPPTLHWPGQTTVQLATQTRVDLDRTARRIELSEGIVEIEAQDQPVTIATKRLTATLKQGSAWVRADDDRTTLWLKQGEMEVTHATSGRIEMSLPMTFVEAKGRTAPTPPLPVSQARADAWSGHAPEVITQIEQAAAEPVTAAPSGRWIIQVASLAERQQADQLQQRLRAGGVDADIVSADVNGSMHYRVRVNGFVSRADAERFAADHHELLGTDNPWITCPGQCAP